MATPLLAIAPPGAASFDDPLAGRNTGGRAWMSGVYRTAPATRAPGAQAPAAAPAAPAARAPVTVDGATGKVAAPPQRQFLNAQDVRYDRPGSVAGYYGWNASNIDQVVKAALSGPSKNAANIRESMSGYLMKRGATLDRATPDQRIAAMDYAYREEARKQQTKQGFFDTVLGKIVNVGLVVAASAVGGPAAGAAVGATTGGIQDGWKGAVFGAAQGYGIGKGVQWAQGGGFSNLSATLTGKGAATGGGSALSFGGDVVGAAARLPATLPTGINAAAFASTPGVGIAGKVFPVLNAASSAASLGSKVKSGLDTAGKVAGVANTGLNLRNMLVGAGATGAAYAAGAALSPPSAPAPTAPPPDPGPTMPVAAMDAEADRLRRRRRAVRTNFTWGKPLLGKLERPELSAPFIGVA